MKPKQNNYEFIEQLIREQAVAVERYWNNQFLQTFNTKRITKTSKFSRVKSKGQLVELEYKDFLSPSGRKLKTNEK